MLFYYSGFSSGLSSYTECKLDKKMPPEFYYLFGINGFYRILFGDNKNDREEEMFQKANPEFQNIYRKANSKFEYFHSIALKLYKTGESINPHPMPHEKEWHMFVTTPFRNHLVDRV